jgi:hypothetical protein
MYFIQELNYYICNPPDIHNELIYICGQQILTEIVDDCRRSTYFAIIADECTGIFCRPQRIITSIILVKACRFSATIFLWLLEIMLATDSCFPCFARIKLSAVFCAQCCLFNPPDSREKAFSSSEVTDWKNLISLAKRHENLSHHRGCVVMADNSIRAKQGKHEEYRIQRNSCSHVAWNLLFLTPKELKIKNN